MGERMSFSTITPLNRPLCVNIYCRSLLVFNVCVSDRITSKSLCALGTLRFDTIRTDTNCPLGSPFRGFYQKSRSGAAKSKQKTEIPRITLLQYPGKTVH